ncbi:MAG: tryptophan synthase subunit alpha [Actinomycetota bacterium]|nr:tryptophan synthase subunit alpha [Actinomycetota bacterium]
MTGPGTHQVGALEARLRERRDAGSKLVVPYLTGGLDGEWIDTLRALAAAGADAIEVGIPFSDPVMDGPTIQEASERALRSGTTRHSILDALRGADVDVPIAVMTYYNLVARAGHRRSASELAAAGVAGAILPDLPLDEAGPWLAAADEAGVATVLLAAPTTPDDRLAAIGARSRGFLYAVGLLGVTGERRELAASARAIAARCMAVTDLPVLVGVGVSNAAQARELCEVADGVVVGSALVRRLLDGAGPKGAGEFLAELRAAVDG